MLDSGSSSKSNPSTRESVNVPAHATHQDQASLVEVEHDNLMQTEQVEETADSLEAIVEENVEVHGVEGISVFSEDYINGDPGLRIPLDRFAPNIRDDVRFAYIRMGASRPTSCTFPQIEMEDAFSHNGIRTLIG